MTEFSAFIDRLSVVIVNWNLKNDTIECLESLIKAGVKPGQIILIDNGSTDGSPLAFEKYFENRLRLVSNEQNIGYAAATNQGIQLALEQGTDWILLLNNDTTVASDFFAELRLGIEAKSFYGIVAPLIFYDSKPEQIWYLGDFLIPGTLITTRAYHNQAYEGGLPQVMPVDFVSGCAMMVRREVFQKVGLFDASLVMYGEEVDFCWRARLAGVRCACITQAVMWHKVSLSAKKEPLKTRYLRMRNQIRFYKKYASKLQYLIMFPFSLVQLSRLLLNDLLGARSDLLRSTLRGWVDGWFLR